MKLALCITAYVALTVLFAMLVGKFLAFNDRANLEQY